jgi:TetR/AcrR family transcriptional regulator
MGTMERKEREKERRRTEILDAAEEVFSNKNLAQTTMDEIAEKAELGKSTIYLYYKSKEDIFLAVLCRAHEILYGLFENAAGTGESSLKRFQNIIDAYCQYSRRYSRYFEMETFLEDTQVHTRVSDEMLGECRVSVQKIWKAVTDVLEQGMQDGTFRKDINPMEMAVIMELNLRGVIRLINQASLLVMCPPGFENIDLEQLLRRSSSMLTYMILSDEARKNFPMDFYGISGRDKQ